MSETVPSIKDQSTIAAVRLQASAVTKLNLADFQNAVPMLRELSVVNDTASEITSLELRIESVPPFLKPKLWRIDAIGAGKSYRINELDVQLNGTLLTSLTEAEMATLTFILIRYEGTSCELARLDWRVELLPRNQWGGLSHLPDMVAAFVQPNEPVVERLLKQAAEVLRKNGKSAALDGYRSGSKHAWEMTSAIWSAVAGMALDYALPPASFEHSGQKVRGPTQVAESGLATCLDITLLFCAALEQAGLNPLLIFTKGHAFAGVWLKAEEFSSTVVDDVTALRKRVKLKELVLFETTVVTHRPVPSFSHAVHLGASQIGEDKEESFELAVDIRRARLQRIKPLASAEAPVVSETADPSPTLEPGFDEAPDLPDDDAFAEPDPATLNPKDRLARWQRKLLDLSLRNNLLNFRSGKKALKLEAPDAGKLEDLLSNGQSIKLLPRPDLMEGTDPRNQAIYEGREREDVRREHALDALKRREIFVAVAKDELDLRLVEVYRAARATLQEGGANTLFLALGFLSWTRDDKPGPCYRAPLILVPVTLSRRSARSGFTLTLHDDEPRFNPTLIEMLRQDFKLNLGVADGELPHDEAGLDVANIWNAVSYAIKDIKGWEVTEEVVLAMFSFAKHLMWKDLTERTDQLRQNAVVRHLIDTPRESYPSGIAFPNPQSLDREFAPEQTFCPLPADSSQLSAVMAAVGGKDFVLIGPPGTGKSQTIANLIAQCLAERKRVLFVSEKIAALDVVYRRLREVGLGEFCLELHSSKARKLDVLAQLQKSWEAQGAIDSEAWRAEAQRLKRLRDQLNVYVERLHLRHGNGITIYEAIGRIADGQGVPVLSMSWGTADAHGLAAMELMRDAADRLEVNAQAVGQSALLESPLASIGQSDWSPSWQQRLIDAARAVVPAANEVKQAYERFVGPVGLPRIPLTRRARGAIAVLARILPSAAGRDWRFVLRPDARSVAQRCQEGLVGLARHRAITAELSPMWSDTVVADCRRGIDLVRQRRETFGQLGQPWTSDAIDDLNKGLKLLDDIDRTTRELSVKYNEQVEQLNVNLLQREWAKAEKSIWPISWFGKRRIRATLVCATASDGELKLPQDIDLLVRIRTLAAEVSALDIGLPAGDVWAGLKTKVELVTCALNFQRTLTDARAGKFWEDSGFEAIATGRCGTRLNTELSRLRLLKTLDADVAPLDKLGPATDGLWAGLATRMESLEAALHFQSVLAGVREAGALPDGHDAIARGDCGGVLMADVKRLHERAAIERELAALDDLREVTAGNWNGLKTHVGELEKALKFHTSISSVIANLARTPEEIGAIKQPLARLIGDGNALLEPTAQIAGFGEAYLSCWGALQPLIDHLMSVGNVLEPAKPDLQDAALEELVRRCEGIIRSESRLHAWCAWRKVREEALMLGLGSLVGAVESSMVVCGSVRLAFETNYCRWWVNAVVDQEEVIRTFVSAQHERRIAEFRALDDHFTGLTRAWIRAGLCSDLPTQDGVTRNSEWGILRHEMNKKKRHMPLRELMISIPTALTKLTPCLLMSPLSIAQYLAADATSFDLVVFDEASQIPVWDAVGAIARGKQVVMVGDPKQLPPTNFFDRAESDADDEDVEGDLESILDECLGANLPTINLAWHYRSRNESLIAFSNCRYYGGALVTFPSPVTEDRAVSFHYVKGTYEKGGARINKPEAKALVADLISKLKSPTFRASKLTIGVVTFNTEQQSLIEDLLDDERRKDPTIESYFAEVELEPVFVKNLESVQGDERDIMYFSITYGPDHAGAVSMNFGPMNREGGERRLNVAITRARHELRVFSSLRPEQMDLARTQAIGVRDLKHFLEFAEHGTRALAQANAGSRGDFESSFEEAVAAALTRKGWELHTQVGTSAFRVDLAVVHPDARGTYLTGIECDGATYHRSATARDRDKLREQVLRGLGWEILRVWSIDWWIDQAHTLEKIDATLLALLAASRSERTKAAEQEAAEMAALELISKAKNSTHQEETSESEVVATLRLQSAVQGSASPFEIAPETETSEIYAENSPGMTVVQANIFIESDPTTVVDCVSAEDFYLASYEAVLIQMIAHVVEIEGPVLDSVLARRIARAHGWQRTGSRIHERIRVLAAKLHKFTDEDVGTFFWSTAQGSERPVVFRRPPMESSRNVDEVCLPELVALAHEVLTNGATGDEAVMAMARELGMHRLRAASRGRFEQAMKQAAD